MTKRGRHLHGGDHDRNGAGTARQEDRPRWGLHLVWAIMRLPCPLGPGPHLRWPMGLDLSLKETLAHKSTGPYRSRSARARRLGDPVAAELPTRAMRVATDGGDAPQAFFRHLPGHVAVVGRF